MGRAAPALAAVLLLAMCSGPTDSSPPGGEPPPDGSTITSVELALPDSLLVHGSALLVVTARTADGRLVPPPRPVSFTTSDLLTASVSSQGVVTGLRRGRATITIVAGSLRGTLTVAVRARLAVTLAGGLALEDYLLAVGDTLPFHASFVDINGEPIQGTPAATWSSDNPAVAVDADGRVVALRPSPLATVTASTVDDVPASVQVAVDTTVAGLPATVRLAHAAPDLGPLTFRPSKGQPVTLSAGQSVDLPVGSGFFAVTIDGLPADEPTFPRSRQVMVRPGDILSLFGVGGPVHGLVALWGPSHVVADSGMVRLIQGGTFLVVYLRASGAPADGTPELCYFDPTGSTDYFVRTPGAFDLLLEAKYQASEPVRLTANAPAGQPVTLVLTSGPSGSASYLAFSDPK